MNQSIIRVMEASDGGVRRVTAAPRAPATSHLQHQARQWSRWTGYSCYSCAEPIYSDESYLTLPVVGGALTITRHTRCAEKEAQR
jgi:hypothetical protein